MIAFKKHTFIALSFFFIAAFMGLLLRAAHVFTFDFEYRYVVHAHSHVALMGWIHFALMTLITYYFVKDTVPQKKYLRVFWFTFISVIGMLLSFPFQGYALFSIIFSSLFLISSYFFAGIIFKYTPKEMKSKPSFKVMRWALIYMIISSFGPWSLGGIMPTLGTSSHWYHTSIYLYLHFQYNAWIILGIIAIIFKVLENSGNNIDPILFKRFLIAFNFGAIFTLFISVLYTQPPFIYYVLAFLGAIVQLVALYFLYKIIRQNGTWFKSAFSKMNRRLLTWGFILLCLKAVMQVAGSIPDVAHLISQNTYLAIGFLHLIFLGVITFSLFALLEKIKLLRLNNLSIQLYATGFMLTELIIFHRPAVKILNLPSSPNYNVFLFAASFILVLGIMIILIRKVRVKIEIR